jgi:hypothetical protein
MAIYHLIASGSFDPDVIEAMTAGDYPPGNGRSLVEL